MQARRISILALVFLLLAFSSLQFIPTIRTGAAACPTFGQLSHVVPITVDNSQPYPIPIGSVLSITMNPSTYSSYESSNLSNIAFFDSLGDNINAWVYSGTLSSSSTSLTIFLKTTQTIPASSSSKIELGFLPTTDNSASACMGYAPTYTTVYGSADNGANVFPFYDNFAGTSLNTAKWNLDQPPTYYYCSGSSGAVCSKTATITVNNGVSLSPVAVCSSSYTESAGISLISANPVSVGTYGVVTNLPIGNVGSSNTNYGYPSTPLLSDSNQLAYSSSWQSVGYAQWSDGGGSIEQHMFTVSGYDTSSSSSPLVYSGCTGGTIGGLTISKGSSLVVGSYSTSSSQIQSNSMYWNATGAYTPCESSGQICHVYFGSPASIYRQAYTYPSVIYLGLLIPAGMNTASTGIGATYIYAYNRINPTQTMPTYTFGSISVPVGITFQISGVSSGSSQSYALAVNGTTYTVSDMPFTLYSPSGSVTVTYGYYASVSGQSFVSLTGCGQTNRDGTFSISGSGCEIVATYGAASVKQDTTLLPAVLNQVAAIMIWLFPSLLIVFAILYMGVKMELSAMMILVLEMMAMGIVGVAGFLYTGAFTPLWISAVSGIFLIVLMLGGAGRQ